MLLKPVQIPKTVAHVTALDRKVTLHWESEKSPVFCDRRTPSPLVPATKMTNLEAGPSISDGPHLLGPDPTSRDVDGLTMIP